MVSMALLGLLVRPHELDLLRHQRADQLRASQKTHERYGRYMFLEYDYRTAVIVGEWTILLYTTSHAHVIIAVSEIGDKTFLL